MTNYKIGFSKKGLIGFLLVMIPNIIWAVWPPTNDILANNKAANPVYDVVINVCRWAIVALLVFLINKAGNENNRLPFCASTFCLIGYYIAWGLYYAGNTSPWLFVIGLAASPSLFFIFMGLWLKNYPALLPGLVFAIIHVAVTYTNFI
jgi:hypothetical protein